VSTTEQSIDAQLERLADCEKVFHEKLSGKKDDRPALQAAMEYVREGDTLVCTRLDRLARSVAHICTVSETLRQKHVDLEILDQAIDTSTPAGTFLFHMLAAVAEFELSIRKEAQRAGIAHARAAGKNMGRPYAMTTDDLMTAQAMDDDNVPIPRIAKRLGVSSRTIRRYLAKPYLLTGSDSIVPTSNVG
jgi:DNA invertase Pin-like site-specific DNA recombinase